MNKKINILSFIALFTALSISTVIHATPVPTTGQTKCYDNTQEIPCPSPGQPFYGQDAQYSSNSQSYTKLDANGNSLPDSATSWAMVEDNVTGLIWEVKNNKDGIPDYSNPHDADNTYTWYDSNPATNGGDEGTPGNGTDTEDFINLLNSTNFGGFSDWRLPTIKELSFIVNKGAGPPYINEIFFPNILSSYYYSSTTNAKFIDEAWIVAFNEGRTDVETKSTFRYAFAVHGTQPSQNLINNDDGTVTDTSTGLMWQQDYAWVWGAWEADLSYCENLSLAGYSDWRLPNSNELQSLVDYDRFNPSMSAVLFHNISINGYPTSTTRAQEGDGAWGVDFSNDRGGGFVEGYSKGDNSSAGYTCVRAVRGGQAKTNNLIISGQVIDSTTKYPLNGVTVKLDNGLSCVTDPLGYYIFSGLFAGAYVVSVNQNGYINYNRRVDLTFFDFSLKIFLTPPQALNGKDTLSGYSEDDVNTAIGNYTYSEKDLEINSRGLSFVLERNYNSQDSQNGPFGFGWTHSYNAKLTVNGDTTVAICWGDGKIDTWTPDGSGGYTPQPGVFDILTNNGNGTYTVTEKDSTKYDFDSSGRLASVTDKNSNTIMLTYAGANLVVITDTVGRNNTLTYDANNHITLLTDPIGRTVNFTYDANGNLASSTDMNGNITTYTYDVNHQMLTVTDPKGGTVVIAYDENKRVSSQIDAKGNEKQYFYDDINKKTTITDQMGYTTNHYYDDLFHLIQEQDALGNSTYYMYDDLGNKIAVKDKKGAVTNYTYDSRGNVLTKIDALGNITTVAYDANNNPLTRTDELGNTTSYQYDINGNLTNTTDALAILLPLLMIRMVSL